MAELTLPNLIQAAGLAGLTLIATENESAPLYVYTDDDDVVWYIGKAESAGGRRHRDEDSWDSQTRPAKELRLGLEAAVHENQLKRQKLAIGGWDTGRAEKLLSVWSGVAITRARDEVQHRRSMSPADAMPPADAEKFLIRIAVARGSRLLNSQHASMWEGPFGSFIDTLAQVANEAQTAAAVTEAQRPDRLLDAGQSQ